MWFFALLRTIKFCKSVAPRNSRNSDLHIVSKEHTSVSLYRWAIGACCTMPYFISIKPKKRSFENDATRLKCHICANFQRLLCEEKKEKNALLLGKIDQFSTNFTSLHVLIGDEYDNQSPYQKDDFNERYCLDTH